jgi:hypothetical protein
MTEKTAPRRFLRGKLTPAIPESEKHKTPGFTAQEWLATPVAGRPLRYDHQKDLTIGEITGNFVSPDGWCGIEAKFKDTPDVEPYHQKVVNGDAKYLSIGFWTDNPHEGPILNKRFVEASVTPCPVDMGAKVLIARSEAGAASDPSAPNVAYGYEMKDLQIITEVAPGAVSSVAATTTSLPAAKPNPVDPIGGPKDVTVVAAATAPATEIAPPAQHSAAPISTPPPPVTAPAAVPSKPLVASAPAPLVPQNAPATTAATVTVSPPAAVMATTPAPAAPVPATPAASAAAPVASPAASAAHSTPAAPATDQPKSNETNEFLNKMNSYLSRKEEKEKKRVAAEAAAAKKAEAAADAPTPMEADAKNPAEKPADTAGVKRKETEAETKPMTDAERRAQAIIESHEKKLAEKHAARMKELQKADEAFGLGIFESESVKNAYSELAKNKEAYSKLTSFFDRFHEVNEKAAPTAAKKTRLEAPAAPAAPAKQEPVDPTSDIDAHATARQADLSKNAASTQTFTIEQVQKIIETAQAQADQGAQKGKITGDLVRKIIETDSGKNHPTRVGGRQQQLVERSQTANKKHRRLNLRFPRTPRPWSSRRG